MNKNSHVINPAHIIGEWLIGRLAIDRNGNGILEDEDYCDDDDLLTDEPFYTMVSFQSDGIAIQTSVCGEQVVTITYAWEFYNGDITYTDDDGSNKYHIDKLTELAMILRDSTGSAVRWTVYDKVK